MYILLKTLLGMASCRLMSHAQPHRIIRHCVDIQIYSVLMHATPYHVMSSHAMQSNRVADKNSHRVVCYQLPSLAFSCCPGGGGASALSITSRAWGDVPDVQTDGWRDRSMVQDRIV